MRDIQTYFRELSNFCIKATFFPSDQYIGVFVSSNVPVSQKLYIVDEADIAIDRYFLGVKKRIQNWQMDITQVEALASIYRLMTSKMKDGFKMTAEARSIEKYNERWTLRCNPVPALPTASSFEERK